MITVRIYPFSPLNIFQHVQSINAAFGENKKIVKTVKIKYIMTILLFYHIVYYTYHYFHLISLAGAKTAQI